MMNVGNLEISTPSPREIAMTRVFNAPRHLVFEAWTKPELIKRWLGALAGWSMPVCEVDLRVGGAYRYVWRGPDGKEMGMGGVFREIIAPERLVCMEYYDEPWYPGEAVETVTFVEEAGRTTVTTSVLYESQETRDSVLRSPMAEGFGKGLDALAELLASR
jgi:uncharacterized protein YndB with AHSA1/START domain